MPQIIRAELLRRKGLAIWTDLPPDDHGRPLAALERVFAQIKPVLDCLDRVL